MRATPLQHGTESKFIANWTRAGPAWTRRLNGLAKTHVDRRGPANIAPWTRKISYLTRGSKRDPSKTAFTWDRLCFPEVSGAQLRQNRPLRGLRLGALEAWIQRAVSYTTQVNN